MRNAHTGVEWVFLRVFQPMLDTILRRGPVVMCPEKMIRQEELYGDDGLYMYRYWCNRWAKELSFERRMRLRSNGFVCLLA